ncbi:MAG: peptidylprolyl isomerase [Myxococcota bacterium]
MTPLSRLAPLALAFALVAPACTGEPGEVPPEVPTVPPTVPPVGAAVAPTPTPPDAGPRVPATTTNRLAASHVLVSYAGAVNALPNVARSKEDARARAEEARAKLVAGADFAEIARSYSDDSTGPRGGSLGGFMRGTMVEPFEKAVEALAPGQISALVETPFGYHVIRRDALLEVHAKHLLVTWGGAERAPAGVTRSKDAAKARVEEVAAKVAAGESWDELVRAYSDGPLKEDGGDLGWFSKGQLAEPLDSVAFDLDIGAASAVIETPRGFHLIKRVE